VEATAPILRYRNRAIGAAELDFLRARIASGQDPSRRELARSICAAWDWRQPNGELSIFACLDLLLRLEQWGHLRLPPTQRRPRQRSELPLLPAELIPLAWAELPPVSSLDGLVVRPIVQDERQGWHLFMGRYHYLGDKPWVGEHLFYAAFLEGELVALVGWAAAVLHAPLRERFIGWDEAAKRRSLRLVASNVRFLVLPWVRVPHLASKVLGRTLRRLSADWQQRWGHPVLLAESFVDTSRFRGTCYRAANWRYLGMTAGRVRRGNAYLRAQTGPKALYVYELHRHARRRLREGT
jgi:hypothetical protein